MLIHPLLTRLSSPSSCFPAIAVLLLALLLGLNSLNRGLQSDDYIHRSMLTNTEASFNQTINGFFEFLGPTEHIPWWTQKDLKIKFWRPLSALSHWVDYQLWPDKVWLMHLHNVFWYALLSLLVLTLFRRILHYKLALLATLLFCLDFSHFANISWIANRNSLISACFILSSFIFYLDWRKHSSKTAYLASAGFFVLALLSGEAGFSLLAMILAYELAFANSSTEKKSLGFYLFVCLFFVIGMLWFYFYQHAGFGSANNSMYFSPGAEPLSNIQVILQKIPVFLFSNIFGIDGFYNVFPHEIKWLISIACTSAIMAVFIFFREQLWSRTLLFLLLASMGVLVPVSLVAVVDMRLGLLSSIFSAAMLALLLQALIKNRNKTIFGRGLLIYLLVFHIGLASLQWLYVGVRDAFNQPDGFSALKSLHQDYPDKTIFLLNHPSPIDAYYFPFVLDASNDKRLSKIHVLTNNFSDYQLYRLPGNSFVIENPQGLVFKNNDFKHYSLNEKPLKHGVYARSAFNSILSRNFHFKQGQLFRHSLYKVTVIDVNDKGMAIRIQFELLNPEDKSVILFWDSKTQSFEHLDEVAEPGKGLSLSLVNWTP